MDTSHIFQILPGNIDGLRAFNYIFDPYVVQDKRNFISFVSGQKKESDGQAGVGVITLKFLLLDSPSVKRRHRLIFFLRITFVYRTCLYVFPLSALVYC